MMVNGVGGKCCEWLGAFSHKATNAGQWLAAVFTFFAGLVLMLFCFLLVCLSIHLWCWCNQDILSYRGHFNGTAKDKLFWKRSVISISYRLEHITLKVVSPYSNSGYLYGEHWEGEGVEMDQTLRWVISVEDGQRTIRNPSHQGQKILGPALAM